MQFLGRFCSLVIVCSVLELYKRILQVFLGLFLMGFASCLKFLTLSGELKSGFLLLGCFSPAFHFLGLFLILRLGFKYLQFSWHGNKGFFQFLFEIRGKSGNSRIGFCSKKDSDNVCDKNEVSCQCSSLKMLGNSKENSSCDLFNDKDDDGGDDYGKKCDLEDEESDVMALRRLVKKDFDRVCDEKVVSRECSSLKMVENLKENLLVSKENSSCDFFGDKDDDGDDDYGKKCHLECHLEDDEFDLMALRRLVKIERHKADIAYSELEKERIASASAADEAMAMILKLQREKSCVEIEANNHCRLAEQMQEYDKEIIQLMQWILMKNESDRTVLEEKLKMCKQKLKQYMNSDEMAQFEMSLDVDTAFEDDGFEDAQTNFENDLSLL